MLIELSNVIKSDMKRGNWLADEMMTNLEYVLYNSSYIYLSFDFCWWYQGEEQKSYIFNYYKSRKGFTNCHPTSKCQKFSADKNS